MRLVKSLLQRCADVVAYMAAAGEPRRLSDIAHALDLPKSATHRLLAEMCGFGWVEQSGADGPYGLTLQFALLGHRVLRASGLPDLVQPVLDSLATQTRELVRLTAVTPEGLAWVAAAQGAVPGLLYQPAMNGRLVLHATANGKAFLAGLHDAEALRIARRGGLGTERPTARTLTTEAALLAELEQVRHQGYAVAAEEAESGITAVAVAIRTRLGDAPGAMLGTVSIAGPSLRMVPAGTAALAARLSETADTLATLWPGHMATHGQRGTS